MKSLHGNTQGLKPNQLRRIEKLYQRRIPPHQIITPEFARQLSELSHETSRQIGALIDVDVRTGLPGLVRAAHLLPFNATEDPMNGNTKQFAFLDSASPAKLDL